jgi:hypothetical protein
VLVEAVGETVSETDCVVRADAVAADTEVDWKRIIANNRSDIMINIDVMNTLAL